MHLSINWAASPPNNQKLTIFSKGGGLEPGCDRSTKGLNARGWMRTKRPLRAIHL